MNNMRPHYYWGDTVPRISQYTYLIQFKKVLLPIFLKLKSADCHYLLMQWFSIWGEFVYQTFSNFWRHRFWIFHLGVLWTSGGQMPEMLPSVL